MDAIEKQARELPVVARLYERHTARCTYRRASVNSAEGDPLVRLADAQAIIAGLTPPEGYVLVPEDPTLEMSAAGRGMFGLTANQACAVYQSMLAARPEVP